MSAFLYGREAQGWAFIYSVTIKEIDINFWHPYVHEWANKIMYTTHIYTHIYTHTFNKHY